MIAKKRSDEISYIVEGVLKEDYAKIGLRDSQDHPKLVSECIKLLSVLSLKDQSFNLPDSTVNIVVQEIEGMPDNEDVLSAFLKELLPTINSKEGKPTYTCI